MPHFILGPLICNAQLQQYISTYYLFSSLKLFVAKSSQKFAFWDNFLDYPVSTQNSLPSDCCNLHTIKLSSLYYIRGWPEKILVFKLLCTYCIKEKRAISRETLKTKWGQGSGRILCGVSSGSGGTGIGTVAKGHFMPKSKALIILQRMSY